MYNLILIDDDEFALNNIVESIDWNEYNLNIAGTFTSAKDALNYMQDFPVDGAFCDIKMPDMSGLEFARIIKELYPNVVLFILSAYDDFSYAQEAIKLGVKDYILKPLNFSKLSKACTAISEFISVNYESCIISNKSNNTTSLQDAYSRFNNDDNFTLDMFIEYIQQAFNITNTTDFQCIEIEIHLDNLLEYLSSQWKYELNRLHTAVLNLVTCDNMIFFPVKYLFNQITLLVIAPTKEKDFSCMLNDFCQTITYNCDDILNLKISANIASPAQQLKDYLTSRTNYCSKNVKQLMNKICEGKVINVLDLIIKNIIDNGTDSEFANCFFVYADDLLSNIANHNNSQMFNISSTNYIHQEYKKLYEISYNAAINYYSEKFSSANATHNANLFIFKNFNKQISIDDITEYVKISKSNFTKSFKSDTGYSFIDYRNLIRIKHACILLLISDMLINEISNFVGFETARHFFTKFQSVVGYTPAKYRTMHKNKRDK